MKYHFSVNDARQAVLAAAPTDYSVLLEHGTMDLGFFLPNGEDHQQPHKQDELYLIASGSAIFLRNGEEIACQQGDVLFVPADMEHHFKTFSDDFSAWVVFYGTEGGEADADNE